MKSTEKTRTKVERKKQLEKEHQKKDRGMKKVNRTLPEALISSRLHRPRSKPLGASLSSNWNPRKRRKREDGIEEERATSHISYRGQHGFSSVSSKLVQGLPGDINQTTASVVRCMSQRNGPIKNIRRTWLENRHYIFVIFRWKLLFTFSCISHFKKRYLLKYANLG